MASLLARLFNFDANKPVNSLVPLDNELNQLDGANGVFNGGSTDKKLLTKASDAADPVYEFDQLGAGPIIECKQNGVLKLWVNNAGQVVSEVATGTAPLDVDSTTVNNNFNADMVDGQHAANLAKLDTNVAAWAAVWFFPNVVAAETIPNEPRPAFIVPPGTAITVTQMRLVYRAGAHVGGRSTTFQIYREDNNGANAVEMGTITVNDGNANLSNEVVNNFADVPLTAGQRLQCRISAASGTLDALQNITVEAMGTQRLT